MAFIFETHAQNKALKESADELEIKKLLYAYADAYVKLPQNKKKEAILDYVDEDLTSMNVISAVNGKVSTTVADYKTLSNFLEKIIQTPNFKIKYEVTEIVKTQVRGTTGLIAYSVDYDFTREGMTWSKGSETVLMTLKKDETKWKIVHFTFVNIEDEKFKGTCLCELFKGETGDYVAKTTVPAGKNYDTKLSNFDFRSDPETGERTIVVEDKSFKWKSSGEVLTAPEKTGKGTNTETVLGSAKNKEEAVTLILQQSLFTKNCASFTMKK
ncbi:MAG: hypothetical protein EAZ97_04585 [Bacteroidetes bacterium]|nr:MAG: hypothetical protein EAZ97_04585 [Bacteroidota bacterium]